MQSSKGGTPHASAEMIKTHSSPVALFIHTFSLSPLPSYTVGCTFPCALQKCLGCENVLYVVSKRLHRFPSPNPSAVFQSGFIHHGLLTPPPLMLFAAVHFSPYREAFAMISAFLVISSLVAVEITRLL